ncbi:hypothetical protein [Lysinibacillus fusiformis]|uniref:hypothetical protein n=2 Tax=Lysinibacillus fusiformis TaxID=28031 RepID=UPI0004DA06B8|nr:MULTISPECIES: hypothetical protein [Lysinibacillus]KEK10873.1 hypothetical protein EP18_14580 [Lysinibacillus sphaericus]WRS96319.1 hypothetical protein VO178_13055 [Lysinibacillus fusiformis]
MKKIITYGLTATLMLTSITPTIAQAEENSGVQQSVDSLENSIVETYGNYTIEATKNGNISKVLLNDGTKTDEVIHNSSNDEVYLNGEKISAETMEFINNLVKETLENETIVIEEPSAPTFEGVLIGGPVSGGSQIAPAAVIIDAGFGGSEWKYITTHEGSINVAGATATTLAIAMGYVFALVGKKIDGAVTFASIAAAILASISNSWTTVYYKRKHYTRPHPDWPLLFTQDLSEVHIYKDSAYKNKITTFNLLH